MAISENSPLDVNPDALDRFAATLEGAREEIRELNMELQSELADLQESWRDEGRQRFLDISSNAFGALTNWLEQVESYNLNLRSYSARIRQVHSGTAGSGVGSSVLDGGTSHPGIAKPVSYSIRGAAPGMGDSGGPTANRAITTKQRVEDLTANAATHPSGYYWCTHCRYENTNGTDFDDDHIIPKSKGGNTNPKNRRILCVGCNRSAQEGWPPKPGSDWATKFAARDMRRRQGDIHG